MPKNSITEDAVLQFMAIYRKQALDASSDAESAQRVLRRLAETQRVQTKQEIAINEQNTDEQRVPTAQVYMSPDLGIFDFEQPSDSNIMETCNAMHHPQFITPFITQDDCDLPPSSTTRQHCKGALTQDYLLHVME